MRVNQCSSCGGFCKKSGCERRDNIAPCAHFRAGMTSKSKEDCPYCRIESLEATAPQWHDAPTAPGDWVIVGEGFKSELQTGITQQEIDRVSSWPGRWYGPIPADKEQSA